jgi:NAD(P)-dependent dehydrogenase (short-subunit alcohol dehydrogenase family)
MENILITGANRGIGLELSRLFQARGSTVYATCRKVSAELDALEINVIEGIDVSDPQSIDKLSRALDGIKLDILINNAGILTRETLEDLNFERIRKQFEVNTLGPLRVISALQENLSDHSKVGILTSRVGSIEDNGSGGIYGYRISKAAANMVGKNLSHDLAKRNIPVILLHPGLVATEMTGRTGIDPADAARGIIARIDELSMENTGSFWHAEGYQLPW